MPTYEVVNEMSSCSITVEFKNEHNELVMPISFTYRLDDVLTGEILIDTVTVENPGSTYTIPIEAEQNIIISKRNTFETRKLTLTWYYSPGNEVFKQGTDEYLFQVKNLTFLTEDTE